MLDMGFSEDIKKLQKYMPEAQSMIFSATMPKYIQEIARKEMKNPLLIDLVGTDTNQIPDRIKNICVLSNSIQQKHVVIRDFVTKNRDKKILIFTDTKAEAQSFEQKTYARFLPIHGDLTQIQRQNVMRQYRNPGSADIMVATDVAARGLDIDDIDVVI